MIFKLKNKNLIELDKKIFELNKFYGMAMNSLGRFPNIYAAGEFMKFADEIIKNLKEVKTDDEFEKIFIDNSVYNLESQKIYFDYFSSGNIKVEEMAEVVLGKNTIKTLKENIKNFDYKNMWDYYLSYQEYTYKSIPVDDESLREKFKKILTDLKKDFLVYSKELYGLPKDYDFELVLGQPYSQNTFFHPTNRRMEISPNSFFVFKEKNEIKINVADVVRLLFHEILGHGRQEVLSGEMPLSMQDNSINTSIPSLHIHFEGVSQSIGRESIMFMEKFKDKYNIEDDYIKQRKLYFTTLTAASFQAYYKYLGLKKIEDNSFDKDEEFKKITKNHGLAILYSAHISSSLDFVGDAVYPIGIFNMEKIISDIKEKIGEEEFQKNYTEISKSLATGVFNFNVLPRFIDLYLKEKGIIK